MLERSLDGDALVTGRRASQTQQNLDLTDGGQEQLRGRVVDSLVAGDDCRVLAGRERRSGGVDRAGDVLLEALESVVTNKDGGVDVCRRRVDEGQEGVRLAVGAGLDDERISQYTNTALTNATTYEARLVRGVDRGGGVVVGGPHKLGTL